MATNRPEYRDSRVPRAVKVYTVAQESRHIIVENIPSLGLTENLLNLCMSFGQVEEHHMLDDHPASTEYTDVMWIKFATMFAARKAKRNLDDKPFFSNLLRVSYAPEYDMVLDIRNKLNERREALARRLTPFPRSTKKVRVDAPPQYGPQLPQYGPQLPATIQERKRENSNPVHTTIEAPSQKKRRRI